ncbi:hypothetical protein C0995_012571, partial [Termitomyces sp. Mi166
WEQQHQADLEEDFNGLNPQNDIPLEEELEYIDAPLLGQIVENALEYLEQPADNGDDPRQEDPPDDPAVHIPAEEVEPPLEPPTPEMDMLNRVNPFMDLYKQAKQIMGEVPEGQPQTLAVRLKADFGDH